MTPAELLRKARATLSKPGAWCQTFYMLDADGNPVDQWDCEKGVSFCVLAAIRIHDFDQTRNVPGGAYHRLSEAIAARGYEPFFPFNDAPEMTQATVLEVFDDAIARAEAA